MNGETENSSLDPNSRLRWRTRRRMTVSSFVIYVIVVFAFVFYIPESRIIALDSFFASFSMAIIAIIGSYFGFSTWDDKKSSN